MSGKLPRRPTQNIFNVRQAEACRNLIATTKDLQVMRTIEWEIKVSKLCNLRCTYCYEFDELDDKRRISLEGWRAILESTKWYQGEIERRFPGQEIKTRYVWHGGEPLLLPLSYYREVLQLQREILGSQNVGTRYTNHVPTNLYAVSPETLKFLKEERFQIAVSYDAIAGVRVLGSGAPTEGRVLDNLKLLLADGWRVGVTWFWSRTQRRT
jgi:uncharacterized protein